MTRQTPAGEPDGGWLPDERVPILDAIAAYTDGAAHQAFDDDRGTLEVGAVADLALVDTDITAVTGNEVADASVVGLWAEGREVWRADG